MSISVGTAFALIFLGGVSLGTALGILAVTALTAGRRADEELGYLEEQQPQQ